MGRAGLYMYMVILLHYKWSDVGFQFVQFSTIVHLPVCVLMFLLIFTMFATNVK